jgi:hypothetical protein
MLQTFQLGKQCGPWGRRLRRAPAGEEFLKAHRVMRLARSGGYALHRDQANVRGGQAVSDLCGSRLKLTLRRDLSMGVRLAVSALEFSLMEKEDSASKVE